MIEFDLWGESFVFFMIYSIIILVPCVLVAIMGKKMITQLGLYPTKTPAIQMSIFMQLVIMEILTFFFLIIFFHVFSS